jgi:hypothetical protein
MELSFVDFGLKKLLEQDPPKDGLLLLNVL